MLNFLPPKILHALSSLDLNLLNEIRLRTNLATSVQYGGEFFFLTDNGISKNQVGALIVKDVNNIYGQILSGDVYNFCEQLKNGYITLPNGIRIGVCGEYVFDGKEIITLRNVTSLNVRIAHDVIGCAKRVCDKVFENKICSMLVFSLPGFGKTTFLRDVARYLSNKNYNVLVFDERDEIAFGGALLGQSIDVVRGANKRFAFERAIRAMSPDVIITDELSGKDDCLAIKRLARCGIPIVASSHVKDKAYLKKYDFDYFVHLKGIGKEQILYDKDFNIVDCHCPMCFDRNVFGCRY